LKKKFREFFLPQKRDKRQYADDRDLEQHKPSKMKRKQQAAEDELNRTPTIKIVNDMTQKSLD
jgi:hypothetical protein